MAGEKPHPYQQQARDLFYTAWTSELAGNQSEYSNFAKALAQHTSEAKDPSSGVYIWSTILAIHQYAKTSPQAIDLMLLVYDSACKQFPSTVSNEYGHGPAAGLQQLKWWLVEEADGFQGLLMPPKCIGSLETADRSNILFKSSDVDRDLDKTLSQIEEWRGERTSWIIAAAMQSRCFSLNIMRVNDGRQIEALIDSGLNRGKGRWSKADFIGACIMIRGCGKSMLDRPGSERKQGKLESWKSALESFLRHDEGPSSSADFMVTYHASVSPLSTVKTRQGAPKLTVRSLRSRTFKQGRETRPATSYLHPTFGCSRERYLNLSLS